MELTQSFKKNVFVCECGHFRDPSNLLNYFVETFLHKLNKKGHIELFLNFKKKLLTFSVECEFQNFFVFSYLDGCQVLQESLELWMFYNSFQNSLQQYFYILYSVQPFNRAFIVPSCQIVLSRPLFFYVNHK